MRWSNPSSIGARRRAVQFLSGALATLTLPALSRPAPEFGRRGFHMIDFFGLLAGRDPHDFDGVADHVGRALLASGAAGHPRSPPLETRQSVVRAR
jgi:hypothetical protein